jgi:hypothetical protein
VIPCPYCRTPLGGLATYCWRCERYTAEEGGQEKTPPPDNRSEEERKHDAREAVELLGFFVVDTEQGWRPFECPACKAPIPGGTRVVPGFPDWLVMGHGRAAFLEWKSGKGRQSDAQRAFQDRCKVAGIPYRVVRTTEETLAFLEEIRA